MLKRAPSLAHKQSPESKNLDFNFIKDLIRGDVKDDEEEENRLDDDGQEAD
jgi:hypothetical protein